MKTDRGYRLKLFALCMVYVFFIQAVSQAQTREATTPANALEHYLHNGDKQYKWEVKDSLRFDGGIVYEVLLTSQQWREHVWTHQLNVIVPFDIQHDGALLFVSSGHTKDGLPVRRDPKENREARALALMAVSSKAVTALLHQTPNQPLYGNLTEDELISYTLHKFQGDGDYTWPLLFPMVKSAVRAMDAVQEIVKQKKRKDVNRFVVSGLSKRGWTTWLTSAHDDRVEAFAPMVIDILNMPVNLQYQIDTWNDYSPQIQDYVALGIVQEMDSDKGRVLARMIDPYSYRKQLNKPKMLFMGTNDEYWVIDAVRHYIDSIPGPDYIHYVPNAGHSLGDKVQAFQALAAFWDFTLKKIPYPQTDWTAKKTKKGLKLSVKTSKDRLVGVDLWGATSTDSDFRNETWTSQDLGISHKKKVTVNLNTPASGYAAFYVDFKYEDPQGRVYTQSTRVFVADHEKGYYLN